MVDAQISRVTQDYDTNSWSAWCLSFPKHESENYRKASIRIVAMYGLTASKTDGVSLVA